MVQRAAVDDRVDDGPGVREDRIQPARELEVVEAADRLALGGHLLAGECHVHLCLDDVVAALVRHAEHEGADTVAAADDRHAAEEDARRRP